MSDRLLIVAGIAFVAAFIQFLHFWKKRNRMHLLIMNMVALLGVVVLVAGLFPEFTTIAMIVAMPIALLLAILIGAFQAKADLQRQVAGNASWLASPVTGGCLFIATGGLFMTRHGIFNGISLSLFAVGTAMIATSILGRSAKTTPVK